MAEQLRNSTIDFPRCIERDFPDQFSLCWDIIEHLTDPVRSINIDYLNDIWPGIQGFDWVTYLRCSVVRMVRALHALDTEGVTQKRVLDYGSWFGNFSLAFRRTGFHVDSVDFYKKNAREFQPFVDIMEQEGITVRCFEDLGENLEVLETDSYDVISCFGVIEHIPHTPKYLMETFNRLLRPGGYLLLDTPNLAYAYNRVKLMNGRSPFPLIEKQYHSSVPFIGHHREYTVHEILWMLKEIGHRVIDIQTFNYSLYGTESLGGDDLKYSLIMESSPLAREYILSLSKKTGDISDAESLSDVSIPDNDPFEALYFQVMYKSSLLEKKDQKIEKLETQIAWLKKNILSSRIVLFVLWLNRVWGKLVGKEIENRIEKVF